MRWMVEITDIGSDKRLLNDVLKRFKVELYQEDNITYLVSEQFEAQSASPEVWKLAEKIRDVISEVSAPTLGASISFKLSNLYEQKEDGSRNKHIFLSGSVTLPKIVVSATLTVTPTKETLEEERARLEAEQLEREYQVKLDLVSSRALAVYRDELALKVHRLLQQDLDPVRMYHVYELIRDDLGKKKLNSLASKEKWDRFTHSLNHQEVFGDASRHIASKEKPPKNPMFLDEAQVFILEVADLWFKQKYIDDV